MSKFQYEAANTARTYTYFLYFFEGIDDLLHSHNET